MNKCFICKESRIATAFHDGRRVILKCENCGMYFLENPPEPESISRHFQEEYFHPMPGGRHLRLPTEFDKWRKFSFGLIAKIIQRRILPPAKLLDIGCGTGTLFLNFPVKKGWQLFGVELSQAAYRYASEILKNRQDIQLFRGYLRNAKFHEDSFDIVCMLEMINYDTDLISTLGEIFRILKPGGWLVIEIPSLTHVLLWHTGWLNKARGASECTLAQHYFFFSQKAIEKLLSMSNFELMQVAPQPGPFEGKWMKDAIKMIYWVFSKIIFFISRKDLNLGPKSLYIVRSKKGMEFQKKQPESNY